VSAGDLFVGVQGEHMHGGRFVGPAVAAGAAGALVEGSFPAVEGARAPVFLVADGRGALAALAGGYLARFHPTVVGITGSNGKTTTKDMLRAALGGARRVGANPGNLNSGWGLPLAVLQQHGDEEILVLEMGATRPGEIGRLAAMARPHIGCITNVGAAHLESFGGVEGVLAAKGELVEALPQNGAAVLNGDDPSIEALRRRCRASRVVVFGRNPGAHVRLEECEQRADGLRISINGYRGVLRMFGEANGANAAAACALAGELGVPPKEALQRVCATPLSPHRSTLLHAAGRTILDDCYNANPASMRAALRSLAAMPARGRRVAVLGSMAELGPQSLALHQQVIREARSLGIDRIVPVGPEMTLACGEDDLYTPPGLGSGKAQEDLVSVGRLVAATSAHGDVLLFKGSRSVGLETAIAALLDTLAGEKG
jgi:UDP-N-acetylmuramoyl-tripeptide--D-alanyl-D-alanine ligase